MELIELLEQWLNETKETCTNLIDHTPHFSVNGSSYEQGVLYKKRRFVRQRISFPQNWIVDWAVDADTGEPIAHGDPKQLTSKFNFYSSKV